MPGAPEALKDAREAHYEAQRAERYGRKRERGQGFRAAVLQQLRCVALKAIRGAAGPTNLASRCYRRRESNTEA
jgi:hypothetical protein